MDIQSTPTQKTTITMVIQLNESSSETDPCLVELITVKRRIRTYYEMFFKQYGRYKKSFGRNILP